MRRVIVDQIEALAELNRIVARHGRGLDAVAPAPRNERVAVTAPIRHEPLPRSEPARTEPLPRPPRRARPRGQGPPPGAVDTCDRRCELCSDTTTCVIAGARARDAGASRRQE